MSAPVPGWYDDPAGSGALRWWDGAAWTHDTVDHPATSDAASAAPESIVVPAHQPEPVAAPEPAAASEPAAAPESPAVSEPTTTPALEVAPEPTVEPLTASSASAMPADWYPDPHNPAGWRWWDGTAWTEHAHLPEASSVAEPVAQSAVEQQPLPESPTLADGSDTTPLTPVAAAAAAGAIVTVGAPLDHDALTPAAAAPAPVAAEIPVAATTPVIDGEVSSDVFPDAPHRRNLRLLWVGLAVLAVVVVGVIVWLSLHFMHQSQLSQPAETPAETAWVAAGSSLGAQSVTQGIASSDLARYCAGGFDNIISAPLPASLQGVSLDRASALYVNACETAHTSGGASKASSPTDPSATSTSTSTASPSSTASPTTGAAA